MSFSESSAGVREGSVKGASASGGRTGKRTSDPCAPSTTTSTTPGGGGLPRTGSDSRGLVILGLALLISGTAVVLTVHRGRRAAG